MKYRMKILILILPSGSEEYVVPDGAYQYDSSTSTLWEAETTTGWELVGDITITSASPEGEEVTNFWINIGSGIVQKI